MFALCDGNSFYASCERVFRPDLRNTPICVLSNNDGNVVTRTIEAKKLGIKMGTPYFCQRQFKFDPFGYEFGNLNLTPIS